MIILDNNLLAVNATGIMYQKALFIPNHAPRGISRGSVLMLQFSLGLLVFTISGAGYFTSEAYEQFERQGWTSIHEFENNFSFIGTVTTAICLLIFPMSFINKPNHAASLFILFNIYTAFTGIWSKVFYETSFSAFKSIIYIYAVSEICRILTIRQILQSFIVTVSLIVLGSFYFILKDPLNSVTVGADGWRGMFVHKNGLGSFCLFSISIISISRRFFGIFSNKNIFALIMSLIALLILSQSKTSIILTIFLILSIYIYPMSRLIFKNANLVSNFIILNFAAIVFSGILFTFLIWKIDFTFTGRTNNWLYILSMVEDELLFGFGGLSLSLADLYLSSYGLKAVDSSLVTIIYNLGLIGIFIYFAIIVAIIYNFYQKNSTNSIFYISVVFTYFLYGTMESSASLFATYPSLVLIIISALNGKDKAATTPAAKRSAMSSIV